MANVDYDVVVLGAGAAGLTAAIEASEAGARVLLVEGSRDVGGASRLSGGIVMGAGTRYQRAQNIEDSPAALYDFYMAVNQWNVTPGAAWRLCHEAGPAIEWLDDMGIKILPFVITAGDEPVERGHAVDGMGAKLIDGLHSVASSQQNVDIALGRRADRLLVESGTVVGVATGTDEVRATATIVTTGGFGANYGLLARHASWALIGGDWSYYVGPDTSQGDMLRFAEQVRAPLVGRGCVAVVPRPNFGRSLEGEFPGWLIAVDAHGRRFHNEMAPYSVQQHILFDADGPLWMILDEAIKQESGTKAVQGSKKVQRPGETTGDWTSENLDQMIVDGKVVVANTIEELALQIRLPAENLVSTIAFYNEDVKSGQDSLFRKRPDTLRPISTPPFYATEIRCRMVSETFIGPRIDGEGRVLGADQRPVPGLFAGGACVGGVLGRRYVGSGNSLANSLSFGRVTGKNAATQAASVDPKVK